MKWTNKIISSIKGLKYREKLILLIVIMEIMIILLLIDLFFVPRSAGMMFHAANRGADHIKTYEETLTVRTTLTLSADDLKAIDNIEEDSLRVPVVYKTVSKVGESGVYQKRSMVYKALDQKSGSTVERYYEANSGILYTSSEDSWIRSEEADPSIRLTSLLDVSDEVLKEAGFHRTFSSFQVVLPAGEVTEELFAAVFKDNSDFGFESGTVTYSFSKFSRKLRSIEIHELRQATEGDSAAPEVSVLIEFDHYNELKEADWAVPAEVSENAVEKIEEEKPDSVYTLTSAGLTEEKTAYIVGTDLPKGSYTVECTGGAGIFTALRAKDGSEICKYNVGYDYYKIDQEPEGEEVTLKNGDRILLSGDGLVCELRPVGLED